MAIILIRTVIIYIVLVGAMRIMGKRQLGQLEVSDLVSTLLLSEIAALPIENHSIPLVYAIIPIVLVLAAEIFSAALLSRFPGLKNLLSTRPTVLVKMGKPQEAALKRTRISADELMVALRKSGSTDISSVAYATLEQDGTISVVPTTPERPATAADGGKKPAESGIYHILIENGKISRHGLDSVGKNERWIEQFLITQNTQLEDVFLMLADDGGSLRFFRSQKKSAHADADGGKAEK